MQKHFFHRQQEINFWEKRLNFKLDTGTDFRNILPTGGERIGKLADQVEGGIIKKMSVNEFLTQHRDESGRLHEITNPPVFGNVLKDDRSVGSVGIDFHGNNRLEMEISLADVMPAEIREVSVQMPDSKKVLTGKREGNLGEFYTDDGERLLIFTGTVVTIETVSKSGEGLDTFTDEYIRSQYPDLGISTARRALEKGVDPAFVLSFMDEEKTSGEESTHESIKIDLFIKELGRQRSVFKYLYPRQDVKDCNANNKYTPEFVAFVNKNLPYGEKIDLKAFTKKYWPDSPETYEQRIGEFGKQYVERRDMELGTILQLAEKTAKRDYIDDFMKIMTRRESGGNAGAVNERTGCYGKYQITPKYWDDWAREAGLPGADIRDPKNQDAVAKFQMLKYFDNFGNWADVASAWYSGQPLENIVRKGRLYQGYGKGNKEPSIANYVGDVIAQLAMRIDTSLA